MQNWCETMTLLVVCLVTKPTRLENNASTFLYTSTYYLIPSKHTFSNDYYYLLST